VITKVMKRVVVRSKCCLLLSCRRVANHPLKVVGRTGLSIVPTHACAPCGRVTATHVKIVVGVIIASNVNHKVTTIYYIFT
jgi:hypothetical protein